MTKKHTEKHLNKVSKSNTDAISHVTSLSLFFYPFSYYCFRFQMIWTGTKIIYQVAKGVLWLCAATLSLCMSVLLSTSLCTRDSLSNAFKWKHLCWFDMCVDYVCQWDRLKVIICGLWLIKCIHIQYNGELVVLFFFGFLFFHSFLPNLTCRSKKYFQHLKPSVSDVRSCTWQQAHDIKKTIQQYDCFCPHNFFITLSSSLKWMNCGRVER